MRVYVTLALLMALLLAGCVQAGDNPTITPSPTATPSGPAGDEPGGDEPLDTSPTTAKAGYAEAEAKVKQSYPDAVFMGVEGEMGADGLSESWTYYFNSYSSSSGYSVTGGGARTTAYSLNEPIGEWVDSAVAAAKCGGGGASLEAGLWTVASEGDPCAVDAATGGVVLE